MKNFSLKALGAFIFAAGLVVAGVAAPANAASVTSGSVSSTGAVSGSTNPNPITISMTTTTAGQSLSVRVVFPTGWSWVTPNPSTTPANGCSSWSGSSSAWVASVANLTPRLECVTNTSMQFPNTATVFLNSAGQNVVALAAGVQVEVVIPANSVNVGQGTDFVLRFGNGGGQAVDESTVTLSANPAPAPSPASASAELTINASTGQLVAGSSVAIVASGLQATAPYEVVVRSHPQTIGTGNAVSGAVSTSVTLPAGLEAGWHSLTFSSTAADGSPLTSVAYFKVSATGTLLATSTTIPAELANTGIDSANGFMLLSGGLSIALIGAVMLMIARRKRNS